MEICIKKGIGARQGLIIEFVIFQTRNIFIQAPEISKISFECLRINVNEGRINKTYTGLCQSKYLLTKSPAKITQKDVNI